MRRLAAPALLAVLVILFHWKLTLTSEYVWFDHPDMVHLEIPRMQFQARELHLGRFPLWDPSLWAGQPLIGQTQPGPLFPLQLLFLLLPLDAEGYLRPAVLNWYWVTLHLVAALACYALCRDWRRSRSASLLAALGFGCGGFLASVAWSDVAAGGIFTPLTVLFATRALRGRRPWASAALSGFWLGLAWLSGHHELPLLVSLLVLVFWAAAVWQRPGRIPLAAVSLLIAGCIAAAQLLPTIEFGRLSKRWVGTPEPVGWADAIPYTIATIYSFPPRGILQTFLPSAERYGDCASFLGLALGALALAGVARARGGRRRWVLLATAAALVFALGAFTPLHGVLTNLVPSLDKARLPVRALHLATLGLCLLAAYGYDALPRHGLVLRRALLGTGVVIAAWAVLHPGFDDRVLLSALLAIVLAIPYRPRVQAAVWIAVVLVELYGVHTATYSSRHHPEQFKFARRLEENKDLAGFLRQAGSRAPIRFSVVEEEIPLNFGDYHGVDAIGGYAAGIPENLLRAETHTRRSQALFSVTHHLGRQPAHPGQTVLFESASGIKVWSNPDVLPRAWAVHEAMAAPNLAALRQAVQEGPLELARQTILLGEAPRLETCSGGSTVEFQSWAPNRVRLQAALPCTGMVILSDSFYPGWQVTVDGQPARIWEAYGVLRGVVVPAGSHVIEYRFRPTSVFAGLGLFAAGVLLTGILVARRR
jgi:hypothetical protein